VKAGDLLRKKCPGVAVTNLHDRLVFPSPQAQAFYQEQAHHGTRFVRVGDLAGVSVVRDGNALKVTAPGMAPTTVDMVILSTGMRPSQSGAHLAQLLNLDVDQWGFPRADHSILHATGSTIDGVYLAGSCASPCDVTTAITRAQAAAGDVISRLAPGRKVELEPMPSVIDADLCGGCKLCIAVCPYKAITYDAEKHVSSINEAICRGCGTCAATCPGKAATAKHFTNQQIYAEIGGILNGRV
jgi:heterodisulfide reductase subunit A